MKAAWAIAGLLAGCAVSHVSDDSAGCVPPCMARLFAGCAPPVGECDAYLTAAPDNWRLCFDNGLVIEAQPSGAHRYRQGAEVCASYESLGAATVAVDRWRDRDGREIAIVTRPYGGGSWIVACDGEEHVIDPESIACAGDPWLRSQNPHSLECPHGPDSDACRTR
ncbi:MAG: hypothetical protein KF729_25745 [Sandaracinaceae bacterium]|nr:hypothetical protein [Sandaracinaceae bacterium]